LSNKSFGSYELALSDSTGLSCVKLQCRGKDGSGSFNKSVSKSLSAALFEGEDNNSDIIQLKSKLGINTIMNSVNTLPDAVHALITNMTITIKLIYWIYYLFS
jgi:hypothetical protein